MPASRSCGLSPIAASRTPLPAWTDLAADLGLAGIGRRARLFVGRAEMREVARIDGRNRQNDEHVGRIELLIDDRSLADIAAEPQIALDERRHLFQSRLGDDLFARKAVH